MSASGTGTRVILGTGGFQPAWQPVVGSAPRIAYVRVVAGKGDIYSIPATGGTPVRLTSDGARNCGNSRPAFSANGRWFAYLQALKVDGACSESSFQVVLVNRITGAKRTVSSVYSPDLEMNTPVWGKRIDFLPNSSALLFSSGYTCWESYALLPVGGGAPYQDWEEFWCYNDDSMPQRIPTPSGGRAYVMAYPNEDATRVGLFTPTFTILSDDPIFGDIDVQRRP